MSHYRRKKQNKKKIVTCYLKHFTIKEGLDLIHPRNLTNPLYVFGERVKRDHERFAVIRSAKLQCFQCGLKATHFIIDRNRHSSFPYSMNLYSGDVLMTWDHIIPKSLGGSDHPENGRMACAKCNSNRGNQMSLEDLLWVNRQDPLRVYKVNRSPPLSLVALIQGAIVTELKPPETVL